MKVGEVIIQKECVGQLAHTTELIIANGQLNGLFVIDGSALVHREVLRVVAEKLQAVVEKS
jgi:hypothetical protein